MRPNAEEQRSIDDARMEVGMGRLLQVGVLLAAAVVLMGGVLYTRAHAGEQANFRVFVAQPLNLRHPQEMLRGVRLANGAAIIQLGILLLVATPICRVIFAMIAFVLEKDRLYVAVSLTVLAILLFGMLRTY